MKEKQAEYYTKLNEILVKVQKDELTGYKAEDAIYELNREYSDVDFKASPCIIEAMRNEYANFDEKSTC